MFYYTPSKCHFLYIIQAVNNFRDCLVQCLHPTSEVIKVINSRTRILFPDLGIFQASEKKHGLNKTKNELQNSSNIQKLSGTCNQNISILLKCLNLILFFSRQILMRFFLSLIFLSNRFIKTKLIKHFSKTKLITLTIN